MTYTGDKTSHPGPCLACPGHCCSQNLINVCGYDVWTIARELNLRPEEFLAFAQLGTEAPYNFRLDSSQKAYCLTLNIRQLPDGSQRCLFALDLPHDQVRCGIYPLRPIRCRTYPPAFCDEREDVGVKPWAFCPDGAWELGQGDLAFWQEELACHDMEFCADGLNPLLLYTRQTAEAIDFDWWLQNIQEAVPEATQDTYFEAQGRI